MYRLKTGLLCLLLVAALFGIGAWERLHEMYTMQGSAAAYAQMQQLDPLFAFPGSTPESLTHAVSEFKLSAAVAVPPYLEGEATRDALYPFRFLDQLPRTETARRALLAEPTQEHASMYHAALHALISSYIDDLRNARNVLLQQNDPAEFDFLSGKTTSAHIEERLAHAQTDAQSLLAQEDRRWQCEQGTASQCESLIYARATFGTLHSAQELESQSESSSTEEAVENRKTLTVVYPSLDSSPLIELSSSACYAYAPIYFAVATTSSRLSGIAAANVVLLSDIYLDDTTRTDHPFYHALASAGDTFTYQPFNVYLCPDAGEDIGDVLAISNLSASLRTKPFLFSGSLTPTAQQFIQAQKHVLQENVYTQRTYNAFISASSMLVRIYGIDALAHYLGSSEEAARLTELVAQSRARSADLAEVLGYFDDLQVGSYIPYQYRKSSPQAFLIARSGLSQLFALNNRTVEPIFRSLVEVRATASDSNNALLNGTIRSYTHDVSKELSRNELQKTLLQDIQIRQQVFGGFISSLLDARARYAHTHTDTSH